MKGRPLYTLDGRLLGTLRFGLSDDGETRMYVRTSHGKEVCLGLCRLMSFHHRICLNVTKREIQSLFGSDIKALVDTPA